MPDVFISYAREDRDRARVLAEALEARGWSVWWDRKIVAGQTFDQTIEQQLESARSVVAVRPDNQRKLRQRRERKPAIKSGRRRDRPTAAPASYPTGEMRGFPLAPH